MNTSPCRRRFSCLIFLSLLFGLWHGTVANAAVQAYSGNRYVLELEGKPVALLRSFSGGAMIGEVAVNPLQLGCCFQAKHLQGVRAEDFVVEIAGDLSSTLVNWIQGNLNGEPGGRDGSIVVLDANARETRRINFFHGVITEINLPALNATSQSPFAVTLRIRPELSQLAKSSGQTYPPMVSKQKIWLANNFRLDIPGIDTSRVAAIDAITLKRKIVEPGVGQYRELYQTTGVFEISSLALTLSEVAARGFEAWHRDFVVNGNNGDSQEREGTLTLLGPDLKTPLLTLSLHHLGIYRLAYGYGASNAGAAIRAEAYIESLSIAGGTQ